MRKEKFPPPHLFDDCLDQSILLIRKEKNTGLLVDALSSCFCFLQPGALSGDDVNHCCSFSESGFHLGLFLSCRSVVPAVVCKGSLCLLLTLCCGRFCGEEICSGEDQLLDHIGRQVVATALPFGCAVFLDLDVVSLRQEPCRFLVCVLLPKSSKLPVPFPCKSSEF